MIDEQTAFNYYFPYAVILAMVIYASIMVIYIKYDQEK